MTGAALGGDDATGGAALAVATAVASDGGGDGLLHPRAAKSRDRTRSSHASPRGRHGVSVGCRSSDPRRCSC